MTAKSKFESASGCLFKVVIKCGKMFITKKESHKNSVVILPLDTIILCVKVSFNSYLGTHTFTFLDPNGRLLVCGSYRSCSREGLPYGVEKVGP